MNGIWEEQNSREGCWHAEMMFPILLNPLLVTGKEATHWGYRRHLLHRHLHGLGAAERGPVGIQLEKLCGAPGRRAWMSPWTVVNREPSSV